MTNAELQKAFRKRKKESEEGESRFETWIDYDTRLDIEKLSRQTGKNKRQIIAAAIVALRVAVLSELDENGRDEYRKPIDRGTK